MSYGGFDYGEQGGYDGGGGGGGGYGDSQGGGGGYMAGGAVDSPAPGGGSSGGGQRNKDKQSILPLNIKQVLESEMASQDSVARIDGVDVAQIKLVGCIVDLEDASTNTEYTIEDTTGRLKVKIFHNDGEGTNDRSAERRAQNQIGTYVRVFGNVRSWKGDRHSVAYDMQPISDFNEITMHSLEIIYTHLFNTKGPLPGKSTIIGEATKHIQGTINDGLMMGGGGQSVQGMGSPAFDHQGGQAIGSPAPNITYNNGAVHNNGGGGGHGVGPSTSGFTDIQQRVHDLYEGVDSEQGQSVDYVIRMLEPAGITPHDVQQAVAFLSSEGHLYSTIDESHYRSTAL